MSRFKAVPTSNGKIGKLEYLDISFCECLNEHPEEIGKLRKLNELDMRECSRLRNLPKSSGGMTFIKHVICDENIGHQWKCFKRLDRHNLAMMRSCIGTHQLGLVRDGYIIISFHVKKSWFSNGFLEFKLLTFHICPSN